MEPKSDPHSGTKLLTHIFEVCKDVAGSDKEIEEVRELIAKLRFLEDRGKPWPIPSKLLITLIKALPKDVELSEPIQTMLDNPKQYDKIKKRVFTNQFLHDIAPEKVNRCANDLCTNTENLKQCKQCKIFTYCSFECQKVDWKTHKTKCREIYNICHK